MSANEQPTRATYPNGMKVWRNADGELDRRDGPAYIWPPGRLLGFEIWYMDGIVHRGGGLPAVTYSDGGKEWYVDGVLHREKGLPAITHPDGTKEYYLRGIRQPDPSEVQR